MVMTEHQQLFFCRTAKLSSCYVSWRKKIHTTTTALHFHHQVSFVWMLNPPAALSEAYYQDCYAKYERYEIGGHWCAKSMWDSYAAGPAIITLALEAVVYILITILIDIGQEDFRLRQRFLESKDFDPKVNLGEEVRSLKDADVLAEEERVRSVGGDFYGGGGSSSFG